MDEKSKEDLESHLHHYKTNKPKITDKAPEGCFYSWNEEEGTFAYMPVRYDVAI